MLACFSLGVIEHFLIFVVVVGAVLLCLRIVVPWALGSSGISLGPLPAVVDILIRAAIVIAIIVIIFWLLGCFLGYHF